MTKKILFLLGAGVLLLSANLSFAGEENMKPLKPLPKAYANKHMPKGWWADPKIIDEGKKIFESATLTFKFRGEDVKVDKGCSTCHAIDPAKDRPKQRGAIDFRAAEKINKLSDSYWFWRISEGVPKTKMPSWKDKLSEEERWKVIAYEHTWSHGNKPAAGDDHEKIVVPVEK
jgi:mono/diheme cytochrome c family protein